MPLTIKVVLEINPGNTLAHLSPKTAIYQFVIGTNIGTNRDHQHDCTIPEWVMGFIDGEGCFSVGFSKRNNLRAEIEARPSFVVGQGTSSRTAMEELCQYFQSPLTQLRIDKHIVKYETRSLKHSREVVIPHFEKHPLRSYKAEDFLKFKWVITNLRLVTELMTKERRLDKDGIREILSLGYAMNLNPAASSRRRKPLQDWLAVLDSDPCLHIIV